MFLHLAAVPKVANCSVGLPGPLAALKLPLKCFDCKDGQYSFNGGAVSDPTAVIGVLKKCANAAAVPSFNLLFMIVSGVISYFCYVGY